MAKKAVDPIEYKWKDRRRRLGLPLSFTRYMLSEDRLFLEKGLLNLKADEVLLYRVQDLELTITLGQRIFGVGTVCVQSTDKSIPHLELKNVKHPREVKEMIHQSVEAAKEKRRMRSMEVMGGGSGGGDTDADDLHDADGDGIDDRFE